MALKDPEEVLGDLIHDDGERAHSQHRNFDAIGDTIKVLDACLGGNQTACELLDEEANMAANEMELETPADFAND